MASPLSWTIDDSDSLTVVAVRGLLDLRGTAGLRTALLKCLAEQPDALLVDAAGLELVDQTPLAVFMAVARQAARWPGTPLLICAPSPNVAALLARRRYEGIPVHAGVEQAR